VRSRMTPLIVALTAALVLGQKSRIGNENSTGTDQDLSTGLQVSGRHGSNGLLNKHGHKMTACAKFLKDPSKCGKKMVTSAELCGKKEEKRTVNCEKEIKKWVRRRRCKFPCTINIKKVASKCSKMVTVPKSCSQALSCWIAQPFKDCLSSVLNKLSKKEKAGFNKFVKWGGKALSEVEHIIMGGIPKVVRVASEWIGQHGGNFLDGKTHLGPLGTVRSIYNTLKHLPRVMESYEKKIVGLAKQVLDRLGKSTDGPVQLSSRRDGRLCPVFDNKIPNFGVYPTDCGLMKEMKILGNALNLITDAASSALKGRQSVFERAWKAAKKCVSLSGPMKVDGVKMPHPFFDIEKKPDLCFSKELTNALESVSNLILKGEGEVYKLFTAIVEKVTAWAEKNIIGKLQKATSLLEVDEVNGEVKCIKGTKDFSLKATLGGKFKFKVDMGKGTMGKHKSTTSMYWSFGIGGGITIGCKDEVFKIIPHLYLAHPVFVSFSFKPFKANPDDDKFKAEGKIFFGLSMNFKKFSSYTKKRVKGSLALGMKAGAEFPEICPSGFKCEVKKKLPLVNEKGEFFDITSGKSWKEILLEKQEIEVSFKVEAASFSRRLEEQASSNASVPSLDQLHKTILSSMRHVADFDVHHVPEGLTQSLVTQGLRGDWTESLELAVGIEGSWYICVHPSAEKCSGETRLQAGKPPGGEGPQKMFLRRRRHGRRRHH